MEVAEPRPDHPAPTSWPARQRRGDELIILDTRTPEEYRRFCIPGGRSAPGGELALRIHDLVSARPNATVVINCAGRTRSIIGARVLQRMKLPNVVSLRNGTSGWLLAGLELERGGDRIELPAPSAGASPPPRPTPRSLVAEDGVRMLTVAGAAEADAARHRRDGLPGRRAHARGIPWPVTSPASAGCRAARPCSAPTTRSPFAPAPIVFCCDGPGARLTRRPPGTGRWASPTSTRSPAGRRRGRRPGRPLVSGADEPTEPLVAEARARVVRSRPAALATRLAAARPPRVLGVEPSDRFAAGHVPGAHWLPRGWLELRIAE